MGSHAWSIVLVQSHPSTIRPIFHMTELNLTSTPDPTIGLHLCDFITRCDHCRLPSCHHTLLNCCETTLSSRAAVLLGHMSSRIHSSWRLPALPRNQYMATCALWLHNSTKRCSVRVHTEILARWKCQTTKVKLLLCLFSFYCSASSLKCLHAAHVLSKKRQRCLKHRKRSAAHVMIQHVHVQQPRLMQHHVKLQNLT